MVKLRCNDGIVRDFYTSQMSEVFAGSCETSCKECGKMFGVHDYKFIKSKLKEHSCETHQTSCKEEKLQ